MNAVNRASVNAKGVLGAGISDYICHTLTLCNCRATH
jgi:hypothetical protein